MANAPRPAPRDGAQASLVCARIIVGATVSLRLFVSAAIGRPFGVLSVAKGGATLREIAVQLADVQAIEAKWIVIDGGLNDLLTMTRTSRRSSAIFAFCCGGSIRRGRRFLP